LKTVHKEDSNIKNEKYIKIIEETKENLKDENYNDNSRFTNILNYLLNFQFSYKYMQLDLN
jgi:hypothetical protein